jgi:hypothetical protein
MRGEEALPGSRGYGFMVSVIPRIPARRFSALAVGPCPNCGAAIDEACTGPRICAERIRCALELARAGQLAEADPDERATPVECQKCGRELTQRGRPKACSDACRCQRILSTRKQCAGARIPPSRYCAVHVPPQQRWTDGALGRRTEWNGSLRFGESRGPRGSLESRGDRTGDM